MPLEEVIAGYTFSGFASMPPTIPGLQAMGIFGSAKDANNGNRAPGGPAFTNLTNPPTVGSAWITCNNGSTNAPSQGIDSNFVETSAVISSGWTMFSISRYLTTTGNGSLLSIGSGQSSCLVSNPQNNTISNHPSIYFSLQGLSFTPNTDATIDLGAGVSLANWRMYAASYPAGSGARPYTVYDVTGNVSKTTVTTHSRVAVGTTNHFCFGNSGAAIPTGFQQVDLSVGGFTTGVLTMTQLQSIRTWLLGVLSLRGVTGF